MQKGPKESPKMWDTEETLTRKVALTLICGSAKIRNEMAVGWEYTPPQKSERYAIYMGKGKILRTSAVEGITETADGITIKTANSLHEVKYFN
jgi:hypothetical protein